MSQRTRKRSRQQVSRRPSPSPWQEPAANKKQKKRIVQGQTETAPKRTAKRAAAKQATRSEAALSALASLVDCFQEMSDPRINRRRRHLLIDIIVTAMCAVLANADTWKDMQVWAETHESWLGNFLALPNGIPSRDTLRRTISRLDPDQFQQSFLRWVGGLRKKLRGVVAIDGKTLRRSGQAGGKPLHIVSVWAAEQHLTLGQRQVDGKSNEITAIPELLKVLELAGAIVTIDAMGCQRAIAAQIVEAGGDYCLAVKDNQPTLAEDLASSFTAAMEADFSQTAHDELQTNDKGHGRREQRYYCTMPIPATLRTADQWKGLQSIGMTITYRGEDDDGEVRYYINSFASDAEKFATAVRQHWGIENSLHWVMDVTFREDESRIGKDYGGENVSWLRRLAISMIKNETTRKDSIRAKRIRAGYDVNYLEQILSALPEQN